MPVEISTSTVGRTPGLSRASQGPLASPAPSVSGGAGAFAESLAGLVDTAEKTQADANQAIVGMVDKTTDVHEAMIALQRAEMALQLTVQVRNKLVSAYQDIMRMPV